jgi:nucleoside-diphosphate-sugar epimerase
MYGPTSGPLTEDLPYRATGPNGQTRAKLALTLLEAHQTGRVRAAIGRASDFYGPYALRSTVGEQVFVPALSGMPAKVLGNPDMPHTYTFITDFARGLITLGERDEALGQVWHIPSAETVTMRQFVGMVFEELGRPARLSAAPPLAISALALFNPTVRALKEQLYQSTQPFVVDHSKFARSFGSRPTPHREGIRQTINWFRGHLSSRVR